MALFDAPVLQVLSKQLDASALTQRVIAHNIANAVTPGYQRREVLFTDILRQALDLDGEALALRTAHPRHLGGRIALAELEPRVVEQTGTFMQPNQNNVDIEQEMVRLATNTLLYDASIRALSDRLNTLSYAIKGR
ncbi:MAG: flagellar basal body rod protein FlgB [Bacillota bacterium]|uniref:flagellar basal body rod protein FlgB n=1 Tax=Desulfurispora thermophila TaxID=265470 RepID=UPI000370C52C|nr:flagellar basal body rod protein FlgB [Desulfurispora thermophila]